MDPSVGIVLNIIITAIVAITTVRNAFVTSRLQADVHRLNVAFDQSIRRLERIRDLNTELLVAIQTYVNRKLVMGGEIHDMDKNTDYYVELLTIIGVSLVEMDALVTVVGDKRLERVVKELHGEIGKLPKETIADIIYEWLHGLEDVFKEVYVIIQTLLGEATENKCEALSDLA